MKINKFRIQLYLLVIQIGLIIFTLGGLTHWFRSNMSLETAACFVVYLALVGMFLIPSHIIGLVLQIKKKYQRTSNLFSLISTILVIIASFGVLKFVSGQFIPSFEGRVLHDTHRYFIDDNGRSIEWWVEFVNPFDDKHKERLVLVDEEGKRVIQMSLVNRKGKFSYRKSENDPNLKQVGSNLLLTSRLEHLPFQTRFVLFDYESGTVISNWIGAWKPPNTESNQSIHSITASGGSE